MGIQTSGTLHLADSVIDVMEAGTTYSIYNYMGIAYVSSTGFDNDPDKVEGTIIYTADLGQ